MNATLTTSNDTYYLDWNGNSLTDKPVLVINGVTGKQWSLIDILLDIFRHLPQKPSIIYIPPSSNAKEKVLEMFRLWGATDTPHWKDHLFVYLDGHLLAIETHNTSDLKMGTGRVVNIKYECQFRIGWGFAIGEKMDATLSMEDGIYYLDWGGNSLGSRPVLVANDLPFGCWCLIEVLLDIFRHLPQKPSSIQCGPTEKTRKQLLEAFTHWSIEIRSKSFTEKLNNSLIFDGHSLPVEVGTQLGISMRNCFVTNIKDEC